MADDIASRDPNRVTSLIGVDDILFSDTVTVAVNALHEMLVAVSSLPLPAGAATEATLIQVRDYLDTIEIKLQSLIDADRASTGTTTSTSVSTTETTVLVANGLRKRFIIYNDGATAVFIKYGTGVTNALFTVRLAPSTYIDDVKPVYTGIINAIRTSGTGNILVTEMT